MRREPCDGARGLFDRIFSSRQCLNDTAERGDRSRPFPVVRSSGDQPPPPWTCGSPMWFSICCFSSGTGLSGC